MTLIAAADEQPKRRSSKKQPGAPTPQLETGSAAAPTPLTPRLYLLTNNFNMLDILASGYAKPRSAYGKYYEDLLRFADGWVPLVPAPVDGALQNAVSTEQLSFPILIETNDLSIPSTAPEPFHGVHLIRGAVPVSLMKTLHFRNDQECIRFYSREYEGIDFSLISGQVSPELFSEAVASGNHVLQALQRMADAEMPESGVYGEYDRKAGALAALLAFRHYTRDEIATALTLYNIEKTPIERRDAMTALGFPAVDLLTLKVDENASLDDLLFAITLRRFEAVDRAVSWDPIAILSHIRRDFDERRPAASNAESLESVFTYIHRVLTLDAEFRPFKRDSGHAAGKALLLALLRPNIREFLNWPRSETGSDDITDAIAATLIGTLSGLQLLPLSVRPPEVAQFLSMWQAAVLNTGIKAALPIAVPAAGTVVDDIIKASWQVRSPATVSYHKPADSVSGQITIEDLVKKGWTECIITVIDAAPVGSVEISTATEKGRVRIQLRGTAIMRHEVDREATARRMSAPEGGVAALKGTKAKSKQHRRP